MEKFRDAVREALDGRTLTREELIEAVTVIPGLEHIGDGLRSGWGTLLKPVAWQGDLCFGPQSGTRVTFMRPDQASRRWAGIPEPDVAGPIAVAAYVRAYGPATVCRLSQLAVARPRPGQTRAGLVRGTGRRARARRRRWRAGVHPVRGSR